VFIGRKFKFSPSWLGYSLGFVTGLFIGGGIWQMVKMIFVFSLASSVSALGDESDLLFFFVVGSVAYAIILWGAGATVMAILWRRRV